MHPQISVTYLQSSLLLIYSVDTEPQQYWVLTTSSKHRFQCRKDKDHKVSGVESVAIVRFVGPAKLLHNIILVHGCIVTDKTYTFKPFRAQV